MGATPTPLAYLGTDPRRAPSSWAWRGRVVLVSAILGLSGFQLLREMYREGRGGGNPFRTSDWLINYSGGFVRRGLFGELVLSVTPHGSAAVWAIIGFQVACYAIVVAYVVRFLQRSDFSWSSVALTCAPVGVAFAGWDLQGGIRKEYVAYAAIALLGFARDDALRHRRRVLVGASLALFTLGVFSWEATVVALPMMVYLLRGQDDDQPWQMRGRAPFALVGIAAAGLISSSLNRGTPEQIAMICRRVVDHGLDPVLCTGAVTWLGWNLSDIWEQLAAFFPGYLWQVAFLPIGLLPILLSPWLRRNGWWFALSAAAVLPLYVVGLDYGRWNSVLFMVVSLAIMAGQVDDVTSRVWAPVTTVLFVASWGLPHYGLIATTPLGLGFAPAVMDLWGWVTGGF